MKLFIMWLNIYKVAKMRVIFETTYKNHTNHCAIVQLLVILNKMFQGCRVFFGCFGNVCLFNVYWLLLMVWSTILEARMAVRHSADIDNESLWLACFVCFVLLFVCVMYAITFGHRVM
jgi:hypothetical protein